MDTSQHKVSRPPPHELGVLLRVHKSRVIGNMQKMARRVAMQDVSSHTTRWVLYEPPARQEDWAGLQASLRELVEFMEENKHELGNLPEAGT